MKYLSRLVDPNDREVKQHMRTAEAIGALEPDLQKLDDASLQARRDAGWIGPVYHLLGLSVGVIKAHTEREHGSFIYDPEHLDETHPDPRLQHFRPCTRHEAYRCDITYGTNNEFGFDYLRDNMATDLAQ